MTEIYPSRRALWLNRLSDEVAHGISEAIRSGTLRVGEPLPDREELMAEFVTSAAIVVVDRVRPKAALSPGPW